MLQKEEIQFEEDEEEINEDKDKEQKKQTPGPREQGRPLTAGWGREGGEQRHLEEGRQAHQRGHPGREEEEEEEDEGEGEDEGEEEHDDIIRGDVFRMPMPSRPQGSPTARRRPPLPSGCSLSYRTVSCMSAGLTRMPPLTAPEITSLALAGKRRGRALFSPCPVRGPILIS